MNMHPLRLERLKRGYSQYHVSFNSGVPQVSISYAERWYPALKLRQKEKIAKFLNMSVEDLFPKEGGELKRLEIGLMKNPSLQ